jgi:hypothetical protein
MNPETRLLKRVEIEDAAEADRVFTVLMGDRVAPRREFIETNAPPFEDGRFGYLIFVGLCKDCWFYNIDTRLQKPSFFV